MLKTLILSLVASALAFGLASAAQQHDDTVHHAAMHAEHWVNHHVSARHKRHHRYPKRHHPDKSVHHAAIHAEHWIQHHASPPGKGH
jgi:hypothetical protein